MTKGVDILADTVKVISGPIAMDPDVGAGLTPNGLEAGWEIARRDP